MFTDARTHGRTDPRTPDRLVYYKLTFEPKIWGWNQNDKKCLLSIFLHKIICCGCVLESPQRGDSNTHPQHMILWITAGN